MAWRPPDTLSRGNPYAKLPDVLDGDEEPRAKPRRPQAKGSGRGSTKDPKHPANVNDLATTDSLSQQRILSVLRERYHCGIIHTYIADVLLVVNPYKTLDIYGTEHHERYTGIKKRRDQDPHIFYIADKAYQRMLSTEKTQCILVSGESGAGKTESTKHMIRHIVRRSRGNMGELHERIVKINPLLEAFGNASTVMNQNSSRFGKYVEMIFSRSGDIMGATIHEYLLEKSRVVFQGEGEWNYHIFYYMFAGMPEDKLKYYWLENPFNHRILRGEGWKKDIYGGEDNHARCRKMFREVEVIFQTVGFTADEVNMIYTCLAAILYVTDVEFEPDNNSAEDGLLIVNDYPVKSVSDQLMIDHEALFQALICVISNVNGEELVNFKTLEQARDGRDALGKAIYQRLFSWIVFRLNQNIQPRDPAMMMRALSLGILDLSGFENFPLNRFEQLCINIANEQLQYFFNRSIIEEEQEEYQREGIDWTKIHFETNEELLELCIGNNGMLQVLDDQSRLSQTTDKGLVQKWRSQFAQSSHYISVPGDQPQFYIVHYAGKVKYQAEGFLEKNRDNVGSNLVDLLKGSRIDFIKDLFSMNLTDVGKIPMGSIIRPPRTSVRPGAPPGNTKTNAHSLATLRRMSTKKNRSGVPERKTERTVSQFFKKSLQELLRKMKVADPLFVRCIKPNDLQESRRFDDDLVEKQLLYNGVLQIAEIRKRGYPVRMEMTKFVDQFHMASSFHAHKPEPTAENCVRIFKDNKIPDKEYVTGKRKLFLKDEVPQFLRDKCVREAGRVLQRYFRGHAARKMYKKMKEEKARKEEAEREREAERARQLAAAAAPPVAAPPPPGVAPAPPATTLYPGLPVQPATAAPSGQPSQKKVTLQTGPDQQPKDDNRDSGTIGSTEETSSEATPEPDESEAFEESDYSSEEESDDENHPSWDIAQLIPRDRISPSERFSGFLKGLRVVTYILVFFLVWICATTGTGCVLLLTAALRRGKNAADGAGSEDGDGDESVYYQASRSQLILLICFPHILLFLVSFAKSLFGRIAWPPTGLFIWIIIQELLTSFGLVLLMFYLLPNFGSLYALGITNSVFLIPAVLKLFFSKRPTKTSKATCLSCLSVLMDIFAVLCQLGAIALPLLVGFYRLGKDYHYASADNQTMQEQNRSGSYSTDEILFHGPILPHPYWQWPLALFLVSIKWWENFVAKNVGCCNLFNVRKVLHATRAKMALITSIINVVSTIGFVFLMEYFFGKAYTEVESYWNVLNPAIGTDSGAIVQQLTPVIVAILCGLVCYYCCGLAAKLMMQEIAYTLPIYLATPTVAAIIVLQCHPSQYIPLMPTTGNIQFEFLCDLNQNDRGYYVAATAIWWLSALWLANHLWFPRNVKLAMAEKLFVTPFYVGPLIIPSMMMNRRRNDFEVIRVGVDRFDLSEQASRAANSDEGDGLTVTSQMETTFENVYKVSKRRNEGVTPIVYSCATMWHETKNEMIQLLKSVFRMDLDQGTRRFAQERFQVKDPNYYEYETHIFFDDAMDLNEECTEWVANQFVCGLAACIDEAASSVWNREKRMMPPLRVVTPYGGRLIWKLPAGTNLVVHLKDKNKIRHKKRWSQVMYMYYLLGYRLFGEDSQMSDERMREERLDNLAEGTSTNDTRAAKKTKTSWLDTALARAQGDGHVGKSQIFRTMEEMVIKQAENTFLLALDGDVDFKPDAVQLLVDRMKKNEKTGAACGRIHPIGAGPLVWYQVFEYAVGHWFQKATEHVLGCVLCSPGCFSLFRGSALMDDNVMKKYTTKSTEPRHFLQYDQGEDRWLCTLLLQQGYRVDYTAAADALTYAPEGFNEFFNQRRRWVPSTMANIMDLLADYQNTILINDNISYPFIFYQFFLLVSTVLGPATIAMAIATAFQTVMKIQLWQAYILAMGPPAIYIVICLKCSTKVQLAVAGFLSTLYAAVMTVVLVGIISSTATESVLEPSLLFLVVTACCFVFAAIIHPYEFACLLHGILYFLCIPAGYLILMIYSLCNLHVVSWGTREVAKRKTKEEMAAEKLAAEEKKKKKEKKGWLSFIRGEAFVSELKDALTKLMTAARESPVEQEMLKTLRKIHKDMKKMNQRLAGQNPDDSSSSESEAETKPVQPTDGSQELSKTGSLPTPQKKDEFQAPVDDIENPAWLNDEKLGNGDIERLDASELLFWQRFIKKYLQPLKKNPKKEKELAQALLEMRNNANFGFWLINGLWVLFNYMIINEEDIKEIKIYSFTVQPLGMVFLVFFLLVLLLQMIGMVIHRWGTFLQLIAITELNNPCKKKIDTDADELSAKVAIDLTRKVITEDPPIDYDEDDDILAGDSGDRVEGIVRRRTTIRQQRQEASQLRGDDLRQTIERATIGRNAGRQLPPIPAEGEEEEWGSPAGRQTSQRDIEMGRVPGEDRPRALTRLPPSDHDIMHDPRRGRSHPLSTTVRRRVTRHQRQNHRISAEGYLLPAEGGRSRTPQPRRRSGMAEEQGGARPRSDFQGRGVRIQDRPSHGRGGPERGDPDRGGGNFERRRRQRFSRKHFFHGDEFDRMFDKRLQKMAHAPMHRSTQPNGQAFARL